LLETVCFSKEIHHIRSYFLWVRWALLGVITYVATSFGLDGRYLA